MVRGVEDVGVVELPQLGQPGVEGLDRGVHRLEGLQPLGLEQVGESPVGGAWEGVRVQFGVCNVPF